MRTVSTRDELRDGLAELRAGGRRVALVPTMGYLHEGHLSLIDEARRRADVVVMSVFVNPLQFGAGEDLARYPRDLERDTALARERGVDLVFAPADDVIYRGGEPAVQVVAPRMADRLCGAFRPGHFTGVLTVVLKLFNLVRPDVAVFGRKDFQQSVLIRRMVRDLDLPVEVVVAAIVRADDGLALSSRNAYLSPSAREQASALYAALRRAGNAFAAGERDSAELLSLARATLEGRDGVEVQYIELVHPDTLEPARDAAAGMVLAAAVVVDGTRLIDNIVLGAGEAEGDDASSDAAAPAGTSESDDGRGD